MSKKLSIQESVNFYNPSPARKQLFHLMRAKFPNGKAQTHANFSLTIHPDRVDYYFDLFSQYKTPKNKLS